MCKLITDAECRQQMESTHEHAVKIEERQEKQDEKMDTIIEGMAEIKASLAAYKIKGEHHEDHISKLEQTDKEILDKIDERFQRFEEKQGENKKGVPWWLPIVTAVGAFLITELIKLIPPR